MRPSCHWTPQNWSIIRYLPTSYYHILRVSGRCVNIVAVFAVRFRNRISATPPWRAFYLRLTLFFFRYSNLRSTVYAVRILLTKIDLLQHLYRHLNVLPRRLTQSLFKVFQEHTSLCQSKTSRPSVSFLLLRTYLLHRLPSDHLLLKQSATHHRVCTKVSYEQA